MCHLGVATALPDLIDSGLLAIELSIGSGGQHERDKDKGGVFPGHFELEH